MAQMMLMGMPAKKAVGYVLITGGTATLSKFAGDALGDKLFTQTATEAAAHPRDASAQRMIQLYRGGIIAGAGLLVGKVVWKWSRPIAVGIAAGMVVSGFDRVLTVYDVKRQVKNLFLSQDNQIARPADNTVPAYGVMFALPTGRGSRAGMSVSREVLPLQSLSA